MQAAAGFGDRERAAAAVTRTVRVEAVLLVVLLGVTGFLVNQSPRPAPVTAASGYDRRRDGHRRATCACSRRWTRGVRAATPSSSRCRTPPGEPYDPPTNPVVSLRTEGLDIGEVTMRPVGAGTYRGEVVVPRPGEWEVQVSIRLSRFENPVTTVRLRVSR